MSRSDKIVVNCLHKFNSYAEFAGYVEDDLNLTDWVIWEDSLQKRADFLDCGYKGRDEGFVYYQKLQQDALINNIPADPGEMVTWLDTLRLLHEALLLVDLPEEISRNLVIIQEYCIPFSNKRADYLLIYKEKMLILEFSFDNNDTLKYETKLQQVLGYKERLSLLCTKDIEIGTYVYIIKPESITPDIRTKVPANDRSTFLLAQYIQIFFTKASTSSTIDQLGFLHAFETLMMRSKK